MPHGPGMPDVVFRKSFLPDFRSVPRHMCRKRRVCFPGLRVLAESQEPFLGKKTFFQKSLFRMGIRLSAVQNTPEGQDRSVGTRGGKERRFSSGPRRGFRRAGDLPPAVVCGFSAGTFVIVFFLQRSLLCAWQTTRLDMKNDPTWLRRGCGKGRSFPRPCMVHPRSDVYFTLTLPSHTSPASGSTGR